MQQRKGKPAKVTASGVYDLWQAALLKYALALEEAALVSTARFEKVAMMWAEEWSKEGWGIDWQKLLPRRGFEILPRRWVVERTFLWLSEP